MRVAIALGSLLLAVACPRSSEPGAQAATPDGRDAGALVAEGFACRSAADCEGVGCACDCSTGGVGRREEAVPKSAAARWYREHDCTRPERCTSVPCPESRLECLGGRCHIVYGVAADDTGGGQAGKGLDSTGPIP